MLKPLHLSTIIQAGATRSHASVAAWGPWQKASLGSTALHMNARLVWGFTGGMPHEVPGSALDCRRMVRPPPDMGHASSHDVAHIYFVWRESPQHLCTQEDFNGINQGLRPDGPVAPRH